MKITTTYLRQVIKEELEEALQEQERKIYISRDHLEKLGYEDKYPDQIPTSASHLLSTKSKTGRTYDKAHQDLLDDLKGKRLTLQKTGPPGHYSFEVSEQKNIKESLTDDQIKDIDQMKQIDSELVEKFKNELKNYYELFKQAALESGEVSVWTEASMLAWGAIEALVDEAVNF